MKIIARCGECGKCTVCKLLKQHPDVYGPGGRKHVTFLPPLEPGVVGSRIVKSTKKLPTSFRVLPCISLGPCPTGSGCAETNRICAHGYGIGGIVQHNKECQNCSAYVAKRKEPQRERTQETATIGSAASDLALQGETSNIGGAKAGHIARATAARRNERGLSREGGGSGLAEGALHPAEPRREVRAAVGQLTWAVAVTTVPSRRDTYLPRTLASIAAAGFPAPHLFVDGADDSWSWSEEFKLRVTVRSVAARTFANWTLSLWELYATNPTADRFAVFQDDVVLCKNVRQYVETLQYPTQGYLNLYSVPDNERLKPEGVRGFYKSNQLGKGALALVLDRAAVVAVLSSRHMVERPQTVDKGWRSVDGGIVTAMRKSGGHEYVHNPSLAMHIGDKSSMMSKKQPATTTFPGEAFDAMELLRC